MKVRSTGDKFEVTDDGGHYVAGPFETNAAAWQFADELAGESGIPKRKPQALHGPRRGKRSGKARLAKPKGEMSPKARRKMLKNAAKAPCWVRSVAAVKFDPVAKRAFHDAKLGKMGGASPVRHIDPAEYLAEKAGNR